jgi:NAD(P)H-flavin reductase
VSDEHGIYLPSQVQNIKEIEGMQNDGKGLKRNEGNDAVQKAGVVTSTLHEMEVGAVMGVRGPLGNSWPSSTN